MKTNQTSLDFFGAAGTVTGSRYLLSHAGKKILVDCGLFQGLKELRARNWEDFPLSPSEVDIVLLTHGHLDHCGYLPRFVKAGFKGEIWATRPTIDVAKIVLADSAKIQEEDAERANRNGFSKHKPALPLYTLAEAGQVNAHFRPCDPYDWNELFPGIRCRFRYNGHIIGATFIELELDGKIVVFSGDVGRPVDWLLSAPEKPAKADVLILESTYGDRLHPGDVLPNIAGLVCDALARHGTLLIPGFAVERAQTLMYLLWKLQRQNLIPAVPVYFDSPMGASALEVFIRYQSWHIIPADELQQVVRWIRRVTSVRETNQLAASRGAKIVIAGSGMASGGRILTYFWHLLGDPETAVLFTGYQAEGTRGRQLLEGVRQLKIFGKICKVHAKIRQIEGLSAHADQAELIGWLSELSQTPRQIFITHGEPAAALSLSAKIRETYGWKAHVPLMYERVLLFQEEAETDEHQEKC